MLVLPALSFGQGDCERIVGGALAQPVLAVTSLAARLRRRFDRAPIAAAVEVAARAGYLARGVVHASIGVVAA